MVEVAAPKSKNYAFTDRESTEAWLTKHGIEFQVSAILPYPDRLPFMSPFLLWKT
jgi:hypothetical protein